MNRKISDKPVTESVFYKEIKALHQKFDQKFDEKFVGVDAEFKKIGQKFDSVDSEFKKIGQKFDSVDAEFKRVHQAIDRLTLAHIKTDERLERVENTMSTKDDINRILNHIDYFAKEVSMFNTEEHLQSIHINETAHIVAGHEKRLVALESK